MNLVIIQNRQAVTTSLQVAESFEKRHDHVLRDIETILGGFPILGKPQCFTNLLINIRKINSNTVCFI